MQNIMGSRVWQVQALLWAALGLSSAVQAQEAVVKPAGIAKLLQGRSYVRLQKGATCKANDPEHTVLATWANRISFSDGKMLLWGTVCNDSPESLSMAEAGSNLLVSADLKRIVFKNEVLRYTKDTPKLCDEGQWCPVNKATP